VVFEVDDLVRVVDERPAGYSKKEWLLYAGHLGRVIDFARHRFRHDCPILVLLEDGRQIWFTDQELMLRTCGPEQ